MLRATQPEKTDRSTRVDDTFIAILTGGSWSFLALGPISLSSRFLIRLAASLILTGALVFRAVRLRTKRYIIIAVATALIGFVVLFLANLAPLS